MYLCMYVDIVWLGLVQYSKMVRTSQTCRARFKDVVHFSQELRRAEMN